MSWKDAAYLRDLLKHFPSFPQLTDYLQACNPGDRGLSLTNVKRFCQQHNISSRKRAHIPDEDLRACVDEAVKEVGSSYGRRLMKSHLSCKGIEAAESRVGACLSDASPEYHSKRLTRTHKLLNPSTYHAPYYGYNGHLDQNEKLVEFGVVFVLFVDGKSNYIVSVSAMPVKNNLTIYREVFRPAVEQFGLWETLIVDSGKEFFLSLFMQQYLRDRSPSNSKRPPYKQVPSTKNNRVERMWNEVNQRVGFPIKHALVELQKDLDMSVAFHKFATSTVALAVARHGLALFVSSWNKHTIANKGCPESHIIDRQCIPIDPSNLLSVDEAVALYEEQGSLSDEKFVGEDVVVGIERSNERDKQFWESMNENIGDVAYIFGQTCNFNFGPLQEAVKLFISISNNYA